MYDGWKQKKEKLKFLHFSKFSIFSSIKDTYTKFFLSSSMLAMQFFLFFIIVKHLYIRDNEKILLPNLGEI